MTENELFTLLRDNRPHVPDASTGERVAARAVLEAAIDAERSGAVAPSPATVTTPDLTGASPPGSPGSPGSSGSPGPSPAFEPVTPDGTNVSRRPWPRRRRWLVAAAAVATGVIAATQVWPSSTPSALASWDEPRAVAPEDAAAIETACRSEHFEGDGPGVPDAAELMHVDQRGSTALALFVDREMQPVEGQAWVDYPPPGDFEEIQHWCVAGRTVDGWESGSTGWQAEELPDGCQVADHLDLVLDGGYSDTTSGEPSSTDRIISVMGRVDDAVARVVVTADGSSVETVLDDQGYFTAFGPSSEPLSDLSVELFDASGNQLSSYDWDSPLPEDCEAGSTHGSTSVYGSGAG